MPDSQEEQVRRAQARNLCVHLIQVVEDMDQEHLNNDISVLTAQELADVLVVMLGMCVTGIRQLRYFQTTSFN